MSNAIVISKNIQQEKYIKFQAFIMSVVLHLTLLLIIVTLSENYILHPQSSKLSASVEKTTVISLNNYQIEVKKVSPVVKKQTVTKPVKKSPAPIKEITKEKEIEKPMQTLQETQQSQAVVASPEAFTPQVPHTEQKIEETNQKLALHNSPLSDSKISELALIRSLIQNSLKYPAIARKLRLEGVVVVSFSLSTTGRVTNLQLVQSSDSSVLDKRALQTVSSLDGEFPTLEKKLDLKIPIAFSLQQS